MALTFWNNKFLRRFFLFASIVAGFSVLLGHLHYSIDVFAAFLSLTGYFILPRGYLKRIMNIY